MQRSLFKYFQEHQHAEDFLAGTLLFRSLAYFRDHEDAAAEERRAALESNSADCGSRWGSDFKAVPQHKPNRRGRDDSLNPAQ